MLSDNPPPTSKKPSGPITKRDILANSILQMDMDHELDTFTSEIDCLMDDSDEEEEQPAQTGKQSEGKDKADSDSMKTPDNAGQKKTKARKEKDEEGDEGVSFQLCDTAERTLPSIKVFADLAHDKM